MEFLYKCTCGQITTVKAKSRGDAIDQVTAQQTADGLQAHFAHAHAGEAVSTVEQAKARVEATLTQV